MSEQATNRSFDELARALAEGSLSRRGALKLFAGTAIAALIPSRALADDDCVRVCHVPFNRETEECDFANAETRCVSRRERRRHLENHPCDCRGRCANCLCLPNGEPCTEATAQQCCSGNCSGGKCAACPSGQELCNGSCVSNSCPDGQVFLPCRCACVNACPAGKVLLSNGTCAEPCDFNLCGGGPSSCFCVREAGTGGIYCVSNVSTTQCTDTCSCPTGQLCQESNGPISTCAQVPQAFC